MSGNSTSRDLHVSLLLPNGEEILTDAATEDDTDGQFKLESKELGSPLPAGVYHLKVRSGTDVWQQSLALQGSGRLNWIQRQGQKIRLLQPLVPVSCPLPWLEQSLLQRSDYA